MFAEAHATTAHCRVEEETVAWTHLPCHLSQHKKNAPSCHSWWFNDVRPEEPDDEEDYLSESEEEIMSGGHILQPFQTSSITSPEKTPSAVLLLSASDLANEELKMRRNVAKRSVPLPRSSSDRNLATQEPVKTDDDTASLSPSESQRRNICKRSGPLPTRSRPFLAELKISHDGLDNRYDPLPTPPSSQESTASSWRTCPARRDQPPSPSFSSASASTSSSPTPMPKTLAKRTRQLPKARRALAPSAFLGRTRASTRSTKAQPPAQPEPTSAPMSNARSPSASDGQEFVVKQEPDAEKFVRELHNRLDDCKSDRNPFLSRHAHIESPFSPLSPLSEAPSSATATPALDKSPPPPRHLACHPNEILPPTEPLAATSVLDATRHENASKLPAKKRWAVRTGGIPALRIHQERRHEINGKNQTASVAESRTQKSVTNMVDMLDKAADPNTQEVTADMVDQAQDGQEQDTTKPVKSRKWREVISLAHGGNGLGELGEGRRRSAAGAAAALIGAAAAANVVASAAKVNPSMVENGTGTVKEIVAAPLIVKRGGNEQGTSGADSGDRRRRAKRSVVVASKHQQKKCVVRGRAQRSRIAHSVGKTTALATRRESRDSLRTEDTEDGISYDGNGTLEDAGSSCTKRKTNEPSEPRKKQAVAVSLSGIEVNTIKQEHDPMSQHVLMIEDWVTSGPSTDTEPTLPPLSATVTGSYYTNDQIRHLYGGGNQKMYGLRTIYDPETAEPRNVLGRIKIRIEHNRYAPHVLFGGSRDRNIMRDNLGRSVPMFVWRAANKWEYIGHYACERVEMLPNGKLPYSDEEVRKMGRGSRDSLSTRLGWAKFWMKKMKAEDVLLNGD